MIARPLTLSALALLAGLAVTSAAQAEWPVCNDFSVALKTAKKSYTPIAVALLIPDINGTVSSSLIKHIERYENLPAFQNMVCVTIPSSHLDSDSDIKELRTKLTPNPKSTLSSPLIVILDGSGHVLGTQNAADKINSHDLSEQTTMAWSVVNWEKTADVDLKTVETKIAHRQYAQLDAMLAKIEDMDKKITAKLTLKSPWQPQRVPPAIESGANSDDPEQQKRVEQANKKRSEALARNNQWFYYDEIQAARTKLTDALQTEFDAAKGLFNAGQFQEAQKAVLVITFYKADDDLAKKITDLKIQIEQAARSGVKPASAASAAPVKAAK